MLYPVALVRRVDILTSLLEQPHELIGEVLLLLDLKDLLSLRITSRRLHQLVHSHEQAICARYYSRIRHEHAAALQLPVTLRGLPNDLTSYIELQRRYEPIHQLSLAFSQHIAMKLQLRVPFPTKETEWRWRERKTLVLHRQLFPNLFALNGFLESFRTVFMLGEQDFAGLSDDEYLCLQNVYDFDQQHIIEGVYSWSTKSIVNITAALQVFLGIAAANRLSLKSRSPRYPFASVKKILIFCGLMPFKSILCCTSQHGTNPTEQLISASERVVHNGRAKDLKPPLSSIHHFDTTRLEEAPTEQSSRGITVRNAFVDRQDLWTNAACAVAQRKGVRHGFPPNINEWLRSKLEEPATYLISLASKSKIKMAAKKVGAVQLNNTYVLPTGSLGRNILISAVVMALSARKEVISPGSPIYDYFLAQSPDALRIATYIQNGLFYFLFGAHALEVPLFAYLRLAKHGISLFSLAWFQWSATVFVGGVLTWNHFDQVLTKKAASS
ncbi:hypothetical protein DV738_g3655, partial [Chaetothyriales sp. CBS 135597]